VPLTQISTPVPAAILDTNVVLGWLVFRDPRCAPLASAIEAGTVRWLASAWMRAELDHVLGRGLGERWVPDLAAIGAAWEHFAQAVAQPELMPVGDRLHCTDPLDQPFIDLAVNVGANYLITRDRALLKLARRASKRGIVIATPESAFAPVAPQR